MACEPFSVVLIAVIGAFIGVAAMCLAQIGGGIE